MGKKEIGEERRSAMNGAKISIEEIQNAGIAVTCGTLIHFVLEEGLTQRFTRWLDHADMGSADEIAEFLREIHAVANPQCEDPVMRKREEGS